MSAALYPEGKPYDSGHFPVGDGHALYFERHGNPEGVPVVYLHGGPGGGCSFEEHRWFDPACYNILLFDQRGAGKSTPYASVEANSIDHLVSDLEALRKNFGIEKWLVTGGSWGTALAMFYATRYPERVERLLLRAVFFADEQGADYIIEEDGAAQSNHNKYFDTFRALVPHVPAGQPIKHAYYDLLTASDEVIAVEAAGRFIAWNATILTPNMQPTLVEMISAEPEKLLAITRIFFHFATHEYSDEAREEILEGMKKFSGLVDIIHGRQDHNCPVENAILLDQICANSRLDIVENGGHGMIDPPIRDAFIAVTEKWKAEFLPKLEKTTTAPKPERH